MKKALKEFYKENFIDSTKLSNTEYEITFKSHTNENETDTYILELREVKENTFIGLLFEVVTSTILYKGQLVQINYKGSMVNMIEVNKNFEGYKINKLDKEYLRYNEVIVSRINKLTNKKELQIK